MNDQELLQEQIESYLTGNLKGKDLIAFEKALEKNQELAQTVSLVKDVDLALNNVVLEEEIVPIFKSLGKKYIPDEKEEEENKESIQPPKKNWKPVKVLIIFAMVAAISFLLWNILNKPPIAEEEQIFASYYEPYASDKIKRGGDASVVAYQQALDFYKATEYDKAIPILKEELIAKPNDAAIQLLLGNCYLSTKPMQTQAAIEIFEVLAKDNTHLYTEISQWYLALAYINDEQEELAQPVLQALADKKIGKYPKLAEQVLLKIKD